MAALLSASSYSSSLSWQLPHTGELVPPAVQNNCFLLVISILFMLRFACIGFLRLMNPIEGMETRAKQLLLCLSSPLVHRFNGIEVDTVKYFSFILFHTSTI